MKMFNNPPHPDALKILIFEVAPFDKFTKF